MPEISLAQVAQAVGVLAAKVDARGREQEHALSQQAVLMCAVTALVRTHPNAEDFADSFRLCWQRTGLANQSFPANSAARQGLDEMLAVLELHCAARLNVRPPDVADPPLGREAGDV